jgi:hypothetical protein
MTDTVAEYIIKKLITKYSFQVPSERAFKEANVRATGLYPTRDVKFGQVFRVPSVLMDMPLARSSKTRWDWDPSAAGLCSLFESTG